MSKDPLLTWLLQSFSSYSHLVPSKQSSKHHQNKLSAKKLHLIFSPNTPILSDKHSFLINIFITSKSEIRASIMAVQYSDNSWMVQHIATDPHYKILSRELVLKMFLWMINNNEMYYFLNFFQLKTRWAYKTYYGFLQSFQHVHIEPYVYMSAILAEFQKKESEMQVSDLDKADYPQIYKKLLLQVPELLINSFGLQKDSFSQDRLLGCQAYFKNLKTLIFKMHFQNTGLVVFHGQWWN